MDKEVKCKDCKWHDDCICVVCEEGHTVVCSIKSKHMQKDNSCEKAELSTK